MFVSRAVDPHSFFVDPDPAVFLSADEMRIYMYNWHQTKTHFKFHAGLTKSQDLDPFLDQNSIASWIQIRIRKKTIVGTHSKH